MAFLGFHYVAPGRDFFQNKDHLFRYGDPHEKIRWSWDHLIFIMGIPTLVRRHLYTEIAPSSSHDDVIKWRHFPRYWLFVQRIHQSQVNSPHKRQWRGALMFSLICVWINGWVNNRKADDLRCHCAHYDVIVIQCIVMTIYQYDNPKFVAIWAPIQYKDAVLPV